MRRLLAASLSFVVLVSVVCALSAQALQPGGADFTRLAGTWQLETGGNSPVATERRVITVSPEWLRVETLRQEDARPPIITYRFDGRETVNPFGSGKATSRLVLERGSIVTETIYEINNAPITVRETLSTNSAGNELTVNAVVRVEHGYEGPLAAGESRPPNVSNAMMVFRRQP